MKKFLNDHLVVKDLEEKKPGFTTGREVEWKKGLVIESNQKDLVGLEVIYYPSTRVLKDKKENTFYITEKSIYEIFSPYGN